MLNAIIALGPDNLIGTLNNTLPWEGDEFKFLRSVDMKIFQEFTIGKDIVMGRKTWDSLNKKKLKGRNKHYIITSKPWVDEDPEVISVTLTDFNENFLSLYKNSKDNDLVCIGGKQLFENFVNEFDSIIINKIESKQLKNFKDGIYLNYYSFVSEPYNLILDNNYVRYFSFFDNNLKSTLHSLRYIRKTQS